MENSINTRQKLTRDQIGTLSNMLSSPSDREMALTILANRDRNDRETQDVFRLAAYPSIYISIPLLKPLYFIKMYGSPVEIDGRIAFTGHADAYTAIIQYYDCQISCGVGDYTKVFDSGREVVEYLLGNGTLIIQQV